MIATEFVETAKQKVLFQGDELKWRWRLLFEIICTFLVLRLCCSHGYFVFFFFTFTKGY